MGASRQNPHMTRVLCRMSVCGDEVVRHVIVDLGDAGEFIAGGSGQMGLRRVTAVQSEHFSRRLRLAEHLHRRNVTPK